MNKIIKTLPPPSPNKKEPYLDFEKDIEIGDNYVIESHLEGKKLEEWQKLKDDEDADDFEDGNIKVIEKKFLF